MTSTQMNWALAGTFVVWMVIWFYLLKLYLWLVSQLGAYLHKKDVERQFRALLQREVNAVSAARKARIDGWVKEEESKYMKDITHKFLYPDTSIVDAITRDDVPFYCSEPEQPQGPRAA